MKPAAVLLMVSFAAALGACGDRTEEGAPASRPAAEAPPIDTSTPPRVVEAPAEATPAPPEPATAPPEPAPPRPATTPSAPTTTPPEAATAPPAPATTPPQPATAPPGPAIVAESPSVAPPDPPPVSQSARVASGTVLRTEKLYSEPASTSKVTASVAEGTSVDILAKQGGWLRVRAGSATGWIRLLSVRAGVGGLGGAGVGDVVGAATTRSDPTRVVAVAGVRGLNDEDLKQAEFNAEELERMEARHVTATQVRSFASQSGLAVVNVPDLPKPQAGQSSSTRESN